VPSSENADHIIKEQGGNRFDVSKCKTLILNWDRAVRLPNICWKIPKVTNISLKIEKGRRRDAGEIPSEGGRLRYCLYLCNMIDATKVRFTPICTFYITII